MPNLVLADLEDVVGEPRVLDIRLAEALEFERPRDIRKLIDRNREELERHGPLRHHGAMVEIGSGAQREVTEYWLNEGQAILICMRSDAPRAADVRTEIISVFQAWRNGRLIPRTSAPVSLDAIGNLFDQKLVPVRRDIAEVKLEISNVRDNVTFLTKRVDDIVPRRDFTQNTRRLFCIVITKFFARKCPCCQRVAVVSENHRELADAQADHFNGRERNSIEDGWLVCRSCNYRLHHDVDFKRQSKPLFDAFQIRRRELFGTPGIQSFRARKRRSSKTSTDPRQRSLFD